MRYKKNSENLRRKLKPHRALLAVIIGLAALGFWGLEGTQIISSINPKLGQELALAAHPPLSVWITSPDYAFTAPMIISTPAGVRYEDGVIDVMQGSTLSAHLAEQKGETPELLVDGNSTDFSVDDHGDFATSQKLTSGQKISIHRGWLTLASWKIHIITDTAPKVALTEPPTINESKTIRLSYSASDSFGINDISLVITPHNPKPGANNASIEIPLAITPSKTISHVDFEDFTSEPWAGQKVSLALIATNIAGKRTVSTSADITVPERTFFHPVAKVLIEERKRLMEHPTDEPLREETANIMATIAHDTSDYHGDPVVLMALRSGAVRLILDKDIQSAISVNDLLWQAAARIEDGSSGTALHMLKDAREDLANAIARDAGQEEIQKLSERLQKALGVFATRLAAPPSESSSNLLHSNSQTAP